MDMPFLLANFYFTKKALDYIATKGAINGSSYKISFYEKHISLFNEWIVVAT
ncbi:hypothetical protein WAX46_04750 [Bacillus sp. FJAT-53060]|uniref:hypothetical protein n=1 Tax=Bacillus sp. FJAT-53060 TaxID=3127666 RepID=UPI003013DE86